MVTTPGERAAKIRCGSKLEPCSGGTFDVGDAGSEDACEGVAFTTTVFVPSSSQPVPFPMPKAAPQPRTAATTVTTARAESRIGLTVATVLRGVRFPVKTVRPPWRPEERAQISSGPAAGPAR